MPATALIEKLDERGAEYELLPHRHTETAAAEARVLGVPPEWTAKTVILRVPTGFVRAIVPASRRVDLARVRSVLGVEDVALATEQELVGAYPEFELGMQIFTEEQAEAFSLDVLDATKIVPEELVPVTPVGRMVLNRNPDNFFAETEQVAFCAAHIVPGIDFSNDPLLAGRIHSYVDTQISRLGGPNFHEIPINTPLAPVHNNQRDGMHRQTINRGRVSYEPNSLAGGCPFQAGTRGFTSFPQHMTESKVRAKPRS